MKRVIFIILVSFTYLPLFSQVFIREYDSNDSLLKDIELVGSYTFTTDDTFFYLARCFYDTNDTTYATFTIVNHGKVVDGYQYKVTNIKGAIIYYTFLSDYHAVIETHENKSYRWYAGKGLRY